MYNVIGTIREITSDPNSAIIGLVLDRNLNGTQAHGLNALKPFADKNLLEVKLSVFYSAKVQIYYSAILRRYIARTDRDSTVSNNLDALPTYSKSLNQSSSSLKMY